MVQVTQKQGLIKHVVTMLAVASMSLSSVSWAERISLPELGNSASNVLSKGEEKEYAQKLIRQMRAYNLLVEDPLINDFFSDMGFKLAAHSDQPDAAFTFVVLDQKVINAFAAPGGVIALHSALILLADDQDEVAGVLSHEIAHITQMHLYRAFEKAKTMNVMAMLAMMGAILAGGGNGQVVTGAMMGAQAVAQQAQINFTRQNEIEADRVGIKTLSEAGYDPQGMADFFAKMGHTTRANGEEAPEFLRTHPVSVNRIAEAEDRIQQLPHVTPDEGRQFYIVQARLRALLETDPKKAIRHFRTELEKPASKARSMGNRYGLAIALQRDTQFDKAAAILTELHNQEPTQLAFQLQMADLELDRNHQQLAIKNLADLYHVFPGNRAIAIEYSKALLTQNTVETAKTASSVLKQQLVQTKDDPNLYAMYARASSQAGDDVRATLAIAESYYQKGGIEEAITQLEKLSRRSDLDYYQRARVNARLTELRIEIGELDQPSHEG